MERRQADKYERKREKEKEIEIFVIKNYIKHVINSKVCKGTQINELDIEEIREIVKNKILSSLQNPKLIDSKTEERLRIVVADFDILFRTLFEEEIKEREKKVDIKRRLEENIKKSGDIHKTADLFNQMIREYRNTGQGIISAKTNYEGNTQASGKEQKKLQYIPIGNYKKRSSSDRDDQMEIE